MTKDLSQKIIELMDLFDGEVTTADQIDRPQQALDREAIIDFNKRNPMAGGGMLVQPSADGSRPGYAKDDKLPTKKNQIGKDDFINLVNQNKDKTYNEFVEILKNYKTKDNKPFTKNIIADRLRYYNLSGSFQPKPALGRSEESKEKRRIAENKRYYEKKKTEEGRAEIKKQKQKQKAKEYQLKGMDPPATKADEAIFKDTVTTAKNNVNGEGRFSITSGYEKSMKGKDFFSNKIKIKDNQTGKTFTYNTFKKYVNKNSKSFGIKNYNEAIKPYRQKFFINDVPNLRNNINSVLIPGWTGGDPRTAVTIQHDFGRQNNPLKTSLAFFDDNTKEYKIRSDFEKSWEKSKTSKTPLADKKKAFNVFKEDIAKLNIQSSPSMVARERFFGKELDLTKAIRKAKDQGAKIPKGTFKKASEFEKQILQNIQSYSKLKQCRVNQADGGRIGFALSDECIRDGLKEQKIKAQKGNKKAARQLLKTAEVASRGKLLKNFLGPGAILGEAVFEGAIIGNKVLGGKPLDQAWAESYLSYLDPRKYSGQLDPMLMEREDMLQSTADKNILKSGFAAQDQLSFANEAAAEAKRAKTADRMDEYFPAAADAREQARFADQSADIISSEAFKDASNVAQEYLQGQSGQQQAKLGVLSVPQGDDADNLRRLKANKAMKELYPQLDFANLSNKEIDKQLADSGVYSPYTLGFGMQQRQPGIRDNMKYNEDLAYDELREYFNRMVDKDIKSQQMQAIANAGGVSNLAKGGRAGFKIGSARKGVLSLINESLKKTPKDTTSALDKLIKKTLDEDFFDKKDRIIDSLNVSEAKKRKNLPYNMKVFEEPSQLEFYDDITKSNFKTKTGPFFDRRKKAGGGILKQAGDRSGPPPESGPNPQGLQGLLKRGMKI